MARILIADDNENLRRALTQALSGHEGWVVCGQAVSGLSAVSMAADLKPDLIVLDFAMPGLNGIAAAAQISKILPPTPIVLYTMHLSQQIEREAAKVGIRKVVSKLDRFENLIKEIEQSLEGEARAVGPLGLDARTIAVPAGEGPLAKPLGEVPQEADTSLPN